MKICLIKPDKSPISHKNVYAGLYEAFFRQQDIQTTVLGIQEALSTEKIPNFFFILDHISFRPHYQELRKKAKVAIWLLEDPYEFDVIPGICKDVDIVFSIDENAIVYRKYYYHFTNIHLLPMGYNQKIYTPQICDPSYYSDILLAGVAFRKRVKTALFLADYCSERKLKLKIIGLWWDRDPNFQQLKPYTHLGFISEFELSRYYNNAKIAIEINRDTPSCNRRNVVASTPGRGFHSLGCRTFTITDIRHTTHKYFTTGKDIETFSSQEELKEKLDLYLKNEERRKEIALCGHLRNLNENTFDHRVDQIINILKEY
jgi:spore maturation protein CgeB